MRSQIQWDDDWIRRRLRLRDLHYLVTVAQAGSMAQAAPLLAVSQPVISKAIADMERLLGVPLLDRSPHGVKPTVFGRALLSSCHAIFDELRQGVKDIDCLSDPSTGELSIGINEASTIGIAATVIQKIRVQRPRITVQLAMANTAAQQHQELRERRIEFSIGRIGTPYSDDEFETEVLYHDQLFVAAGSQNHWTRKARVNLADLLDGPWLLPPRDSESGRLAAEAFRTSGLNVPRANVVTSSLQLHNHLLENGPFLSILPASILPPLTKNSSLRTVAVSLPIQAGPVGIIRLRSRRLSSAAQLFIEITRLLTGSIQANPASAK